MTHGIKAVCMYVCEHEGGPKVNRKKLTLRLLNFEYELHSPLIYPSIECIDIQILNTLGSHIQLFDFLFYIFQTAFFVLLFIYFFARPGKSPETESKNETFMHSTCALLFCIFNHSAFIENICLCVMNELTQHFPQIETRKKRKKVTVPVSDQMY